MIMIEHQNKEEDDDADAASHVDDAGHNADEMTSEMRRGEKQNRQRGTNQHCKMKRPVCLASSINTMQIVQGIVFAVARQRGVARGWRVVAIWR